MGTGGHQKSNVGRWGGLEKTSGPPPHCHFKWNRPKYASEELSATLYIMYNSIFDRGDWPSKWAEGIISPVHKKASINIADNYRKITVMPTLGKVLESILNSRLVYRNIVLKLDDPYQFGFKKDSRTTDNVFILHSLIYRQRFKSKPLYVCFVDFTKAFDYVNRSALYYKLIHRGIQGKLLNLICDMYNKAVCCVNWKGEVGEHIDSRYGVLQGGMLSPNLFTEFLTDLKEYLEIECGLLLDDSIMTYILYADDLLLCSESPGGLQKLIDGLYNFCKKWHLIVSLAKTNVLVFGKKHSDYKFMFNREEIQIRTEYKYLGTIISTATSNIFKKNQEHLADKTRNALFALNSHIQNTVGQLHPSLAFKMYDAQISPIMEYMSEVWYQKKTLDELEKIHLAFIKSILRVKMSSSTHAIYSECGRFPLKIKAQFQMISYWKRIVLLENSHIVKKAYKSLYELSEHGQENWCSFVKDILVDLGYSEAWNLHEINDRDLYALKEKLYKTHMDKCLENINDSEKNPKLRTYKLLKTEFKLETHLTYPYNVNHMLALTKFRISSHNLHIETGRYTRPTKTPISERKCLHCSDGTVEDEMHFILDCSLYVEERHKLIEVCTENIPGFENMEAQQRFINIMSLNIPAVSKVLGKYVYDCLKKRNDLTSPV